MMKFKIELYSKLSSKEIELELAKVLQNWQKHDAIQMFKVNDVSQEKAE